MFCKRSGYINFRWKEEIGVENFESMLNVIDYTLDTDRKRHIAGGILLSMSVLFGGLALTVMTIKMVEEENEQEY